jgi:hypothetical protein
MKRMQAPHIAQTINKIENMQEEVLLIQDTMYDMTTGKALRESEGYLGKTKKKRKDRWLCFSYSIGGEQ